MRNSIYKLWLGPHLIELFRGDNYVCNEPQLFKYIRECATNWRELSIKKKLKFYISKETVK